MHTVMMTQAPRTLQGPARSMIYYTAFRVLFTVAAAPRAAFAPLSNLSVQPQCMHGPCNTCMHLRVAGYSCSCTQLCAEGSLNLQGTISLETKMQMHC